MFYKMATLVAGGSVGPADRGRGNRPLPPLLQRRTGQSRAAGPEQVSICLGPAITKKNLLMLEMFYVIAIPIYFKCCLPY